MKDDYVIMSRKVTEWFKAIENEDEFKTLVIAAYSYAFDMVDPEGMLPQWIIDDLDAGREQVKKERKEAERKTPEYRRWRLNVLERDSFTCQLCGQVGGELNVHHIKPYATFPALRYDEDNGVALCKSCHIELHKRARRRG